MREAYRACTQALGAVLISGGGGVTLSTSAEHGLFGWTLPAWDRLPLQVAIFAVNDLGFTVPLVLVLRYVDPLVVAVVTLLSPIAAIVEGVLLGDSEALPDLATIGGSVVLLGGVGLVVVSGRESEEKVDASSAVVPMSDKAS